MFLDSKFMRRAGPHDKVAFLICLSSALLIVAVAATYQFLTLSDVPASPGNDLAKHAAAILNFQSAFLDGQWLPRLQAPPAEYPDLPLFQFYSTLLGYLSLPLLAAGLKPMTALSLSIVLARWIGAAAIYKTGQVYGASRSASFAGAVCYIITPYVLSNVYGRVALPEATAHGVLPILFYGLIRLNRAPDGWAVILVLLGIVGLSIAHPIFLLYATAAAGLFIVVAFRPTFTLGPLLILLGAILLASFQWLPAFMGRSNFVSDLFSGSPYNNRIFTSFSGLYGQPSSLSGEGKGVWMDGPKLFLTPGILTLPVLILLLGKAHQRTASALLLLLCCFLFLSFAPIDAWRALPEFTWALQYPYRLLAFVSLFVAIGLFVVLPRMSWWMCFTLVTLTVWQNFHLLFERPYAEPLGIEQSKIAETFVNLDYLSVSRPLIVTSNGSLLSNARIEVSSKPSLFPELLYLAGTTIPSSQVVDLWIASPHDPSTPLSSKNSVGPGAFAVSLELPSKPGSYILRSSSASGNLSRPDDIDDVRVSINIFDYLFLNHTDSVPKLVTHVEIERVRAQAYERVFRTRQNASVETEGSGTSAKRVELPLAYSPLMEISQQGRMLKSTPDFRGLTQIFTTDLDAPFVAHYRMPWIVWLATIVGTVLTVLGYIVVRRLGKMHMSTKFHPANLAPVDNLSCATT